MSPAQMRNTITCSVKRVVRAGASSRERPADGVAPRPHTKSLLLDVAEAIRPVYERLSDMTLLSRCLHGRTQNDNECFHSLLWNLCPKVRWAGHRTVQTSLALAVQTFNKGASTCTDFLKKIDITPSQSVIDSVERRDIQRVKDASRKSSVREKKRRKTIDEAKRAEAEARRRRDGDNYGAGKF
ncbi:hypothetical protein ACOMHN_060438 [Nucella lapillus]